MRPTEASLIQLYGHDPQVLAAQRARYARLAQRFVHKFPSHSTYRFFSAPGRTEIGGNHTDHQKGKVLAASVSMDTIAVAAPNGTPFIHLYSQGYAPVKIDTRQLAPHPKEKGSPAMVRGCVAAMAQRGCPVAGFDAAVTSDVAAGSGLSSSAAYEVLVCAILRGLFGGDISDEEIAKASQYSENVFYGKSSGLMDQMASAVGGIVAIDFADTQSPQISALSYDFYAKGYVAAVVKTGGSHGGLDAEYGAIRAEMEQVAALFGEACLRPVDPLRFEMILPALRGKVSDRALLRAMHFFDENARVPQMVAALAQNNLDEFFALIIASGHSSWMLLQNVWANPHEQPLSLALALSQRMLDGHGAWRVHGGGFAGTILAFVPTDMYEMYAARMDATFGEGATCRLDIRAVGAYALEAE